MKSGHGKIICSCGTVLLQCKCLENHNIIERVNNGCELCHDSNVELYRITSEQGTTYTIINGDSKMENLNQRDLEVLGERIRAKLN